MRLLTIALVAVAMSPGVAHAQLVPGGDHGGGGSGNQPGWQLTPGWLTLDGPYTTDNAPELHFRSLNGHWLIAPDVANNGGGGRDFVTTARRNEQTGNVEDIIYLRPDQDGTKVGIGITPPSLDYRLQTGGQGSQGGLAVVRHVGESGHPFAVVDSSGAARVWIDSEFGLHVPRIFVSGVRMDPVATNVRIARAERRVRSLERRLRRAHVR